jgi:tartrate dehydrogenase/decarboxylase/D-malate dehydrogenase
MQEYKVAVIAGDGIGPEVLEEGIKVLKKVAEADSSFKVKFTKFPWGCEYYLKNGKMMDDDGMDKLKGFDAIYLGAVGYPGVPDNISLGDLLLKIRRGFDQYINLRPVKLLNGAPCPLKNIKCEDIDMLVVRENSEGEYANVGARLYEGTPQEVVLQTGVFSRKGTERVIRYAYEIARKEGKDTYKYKQGQCAGLFYGVLGSGIQRN